MFTAASQTQSTVPVCGANSRCWGLDTNDICRIPVPAGITLKSTNKQSGSDGDKMETGHGEGATFPGLGVEGAIGKGPPSYLFASP